MNYRELASECISVIARLGRQPLLPLVQTFNRLTEGEAALLSRLKRGDGQSPGGLSRMLHLTSGRTANLLGKLEKKGYIERRADPDDARCVRAYLTAKGKRLADDIERESEERLVRTFSRLGEKDAAELIRIIRRLSEEGE